MPKVCYQVVATIPSESVARDYLAWLEDGHVDAVVKAGAHTAMIVRLEPDSPDVTAGKPRIMTQYVFSTRELFDKYVSDHAPALRAEGIARFGSTGITFERRTGEIV